MRAWLLEGALAVVLAGDEGPGFLAGGGGASHAAGAFFQTLPDVTWKRTAAAVAASILGNTLIATGLMVQKLAHRADEPQAVRDQRPYFLTPRWLAGLLAFLLGHGCCAVGLALGACTVLSCLNTWCIVVTLLLAPRLLGEAVTPSKVGAVALLVFGCFWVIRHGPHAQHAFSTQLLEVYLQNTMFKAICSCVLLGTLLVGAQASTTRRRPRLAPFQLTVLAAICAWFSVLGSKCVSGLLLTSWSSGQHQFGSPCAWGAVVAFISAGLLNLHLLNMALAAGEAVSVMPAYEAMSLTGQIVLGGVFFDELGGLTAQFWFGVACAIVGVLLTAGADPKGDALPFRGDDAPSEKL